MSINFYPAYYINALQLALSSLLTNIENSINLITDSKMCWIMQLNILEKICHVIDCYVRASNMLIIN